MIINVTNKTVEAVRERERERESKSLEKIDFINSTKNKIDTYIKRIGFIEEVLIIR